MSLWLRDFRFRGREVTVLKTGASVVIDGALLGDIRRWLVGYVPILLRSAALQIQRPGPRIWFSPDQPRPWYLIWAAAAWSGARFARHPSEADAAIYFDDSTDNAVDLPPVARQFNYRCLDVSKSRVATVFEAVFGYSLSVDPRTHDGAAVEKGELNGAHDGRIVQCPCEPIPGRVYQRLINNIDGDGVTVADLRTPFVGGDPVLVFIKRRPVEKRFANLNTAVELARPKDLFSPQELGRLSKFAQAMDLDWGGLDILRDRANGRIYVVDVNKTDMGPPLMLRLTDKLRATDLLADALLRLIRS